MKEKLNITCPVNAKHRQDAEYEFPPLRYGSMDRIEERSLRNTRERFARNLARRFGR